MTQQKPIQKIHAYSSNIFSIIPAAKATKTTITTTASPTKKTFFPENDIKRRGYNKAKFYETDI